MTAQVLLIPVPNVDAVSCVAGQADRDDCPLPLLGHLAHRGWVCVAITYRLGPTAAWPELIADVLRAVAWTTANIGATATPGAWKYCM